MSATRVALFLLAFLVAGCAGPGSGTRVAPEDDTTPPATGAAPSTAAATAVAPTPAPNSAEVLSTPSDARSGCEDGKLTFEYPPVDLAAIEFVVPLGLMSGSHVTPVDHQYFQNYKDPTLDIDVYSPAAGTVTEIQHMNQTVADGPAAAIDDFRLVIEHACGISSIFIHIDQLSPGIAAVAPPPGEYTRVDYAVGAGERIGTFRKNVDYNVVDDGVTLEGLLVPEHYSAEPK